MILLPETMTVTEAAGFEVPSGPLQDRLYIVVEVGATVLVPLKGETEPMPALSEQLVALMQFHESWED